MAELYIRREHTLGFAQARRVAVGWADKVRADFGLACDYAQGACTDVLSFQRPGFNGTLNVSEDSFEIRAQLGFLFEAFQDRIEGEMNRALDKLLTTSPA